MVLFFPRCCFFSLTFLGWYSLSSRQVKNWRGHGIVLMAESMWLISILRPSKSGCFSICSRAMLRLSNSFGIMVDMLNCGRKIMVGLNLGLVCFFWF